MSDYVHEAQRIREIRLDNTTYAKALRKAGVPLIESTGAEEDFIPENDSDGTYSPKRHIEFRRLHGKVQRALAKEVKKGGFALSTRRLQGGIAPDLFIKDSRGHMLILFEIKIPRGAQSTFTAIGQLMVYSAGQEKQPKKIIVSQGLPRGNLFMDTFRKQSIDNLPFLIDDQDRVNFVGLKKIMKSLE